MPVFIRQKFIRCMLLAGASCCLLMSGCEPKKPVGPPEKLTIAVHTTIHPTLVKIADAKGFFREEGLDVTLQYHTTGISTLQSLIAGKADVATSATPIMFAIMKGVKLSILATINTSTRDTAIVARKDRGVASASDLKGRRIGLPLGTVADFFLDSYLVLNALSRKDVILVDMKPEAMVDALLQGRVDAISIWNPLVTTLHKELGERGTIFHSDSICTLTFNLASMQSLPRQRPEAIRRLMRALVKAEDFVAANPGESQRIMTEYTGMDGKLLAGIWNDFQFNVSLKQSLLVSLEDQARWAIKNGLTDRRDLPDFFEVLYIDGLKSVRPEAVRIIK